MSVLRIDNHIGNSVRVGSLLVIICLMLSFRYGNAQTASEQEVKAVFIYNLVNFVEWPETAFASQSEPFVIGIAGKNIFANALVQAVTGESYKGHPIQIKSIDDAITAESCHILFIEKSFGQFDQAIARTKDKSLLTIADTDDFMTKGGVVRFFIDNNRVRIEINQNEATKRNLKISSKLLRLAKIYNER